MLLEQAPASMVWQAELTDYSVLVYSFYESSTSMLPMYSIYLRKIVFLFVYYTLASMIH